MATLVHLPSLQDIEAWLSENGATDLLTQPLSYVIAFLLVTIVSLSFNTSQSHLEKQHVPLLNPPKPFSLTNYSTIVCISNTAFQHHN